MVGDVLYGINWFYWFARKKKSYGGVNGIKFSVILNDELYMLKLPAHELIILIYLMTILVYLNI